MRVLGELGVLACMHVCVRACVIQGPRHDQGTLCSIKASFLGHWGLHVIVFDALFDTVGEGQGARPKKLLKGKIQT